MKIKIIGACTDLGVEKNGADKGPRAIISELNTNDVVFIDKPYCVKSTDPNDLKKNLNEVNFFNTNLYNEVKKAIEDGKFPITIGGDHSMAIGSALASKSINNNLGIIWIDAHLDYNTFKTTITGNLHGLPLAAINGLAKDLTPFSNNFINSKNTVVVGYRSMEKNKEEELSNAKGAGISVFDSQYINKYGIEDAMKRAIDIASKNTDGLHISFDLDVIDAIFAPGVSVPEPDGINLDTAYKIVDIIVSHIDKIKSFDLVEYNPTYDKDSKTKEIALTILDKVMNSIK